MVICNSTNVEIVLHRITLPICGYRGLFWPTLSLHIILTVHAAGAGLDEFVRRSSDDILLVVKSKSVTGKERATICTGLLNCSRYIRNKDTVIESLRRTSQRGL